MDTNNKAKYIIFSAPSGSGKTTLVQEMMKKGLPLEFSISATSRGPRKNEIHAKDYYFLTEEGFKQKVLAQEFVEWEEVYHGTCYGTLKSELDRITALGHIPVFDLDVIGGLNLKKILGDQALAIFVQVSDIDVLQQRLKSRATDSDESIQKRLDKAAYEMSFASQFDTIIINDDLSKAIDHSYHILKQFING